MSALDNRILIFEDLDENFEQIREPLEDEVNGDFSIARFDHTEPIESDNVLDELNERVKSPDYPLLTVLDYDLTAGENEVRREHVRQLCEDHYLPICIYHRIDSGLEDERRVEEYEEDLIKINPSKGAEEVAKDCAIIARGFDEIRTVLSEQLGSDSAPAIPQILNAPRSVRGKLDQYSWGNPGVLVGGRSDMDRDEIIRRATSNLGYWIRNELVEFPGALLNEVALAAYLDVDHQTFQDNDEFREPFTEALYEGPFSELGRWWWTPKIDEIRAEAMEEGDSDLPLGPLLFDENHLNISDIGRAICHDGESENHEGARYYCIMKEKPVCEEHSKSPEGWIPMGATRSRVSQDEYARLEPWTLT